RPGPARRRRHRGARPGPPGARARAPGTPVTRRPVSASRRSRHVTLGRILSRWSPAALATVLWAGCSFVFVHGPEVGPSCTTSEAAPLLDAAVAIGAFVGLAFDGMEINDRAHDGRDLSTPIGIGVGLLAGGILYTVAAVGGHHDATACRARKA